MEIEVYVDGSFNETTMMYGSGFVMIMPDEFKDFNLLRFSKAGNYKPFLSASNIAGELEAVKQAITYAMKYGCSKLTIYHDYEGISKWANQQWKAKSAVAIDYVQFMRRLPNSIKIEFVKVRAHSGCHFNEVADELAKRACE